MVTALRKKKRRRSVKPNDEVFSQQAEKGWRRERRWEGEEEAHPWRLKCAASRFRVSLRFKCEERKERKKRKGRKRKRRERKRMASVSIAWPASPWAMPLRMLAWTRMLQRTSMV